MEKRAPTPTATETAVLTKSRRRCSLCYFVDGTTSEVLGQIAHLNGRQNPDEDNLVWLCQKHHSLLDSRTSQHKNYTPHEVRAYRNKLYEVMAKLDSPPFTSEQAPMGGSARSPVLEQLDRARLEQFIRSWRLALSGFFEAGDESAHSIPLPSVEAVRSLINRWGDYSLRVLQPEILARQERVMAQASAIVFVYNLRDYHTSGDWLIFTWTGERDHDQELLPARKIEFHERLTTAHGLLLELEGFLAGTIPQTLT